MIHRFDPKTGKYKIFGQKDGKGHFAEVEGYLHNGLIGPGV